MDDALPTPLGVAVLSVLALVVAAVLLTHWERGFEHDPQLRAHSGLINAESDISYVRPANLARALAAIRAQVPAGTLVSDLTLNPAEVEASLVLPSGAERNVKVSPGVDPEVRDDGDRLSHPSGIALDAIVATVPERILERAQLRFSLRPKELDHFDLTPDGDGGRWDGSWSEPEDADDVVADLRGHHIHQDTF